MDAYGIFVIVLMLVIVAMMRRSVWLISWKYLVALLIALGANVVLWSAYVESVSGIALVVFVHILMAYTLYYKYVMREEILKPVNPGLLLAKHRKERVPYAWLFVYIPHVISVFVIILIVWHYVIPVLKYP